MSNRRDRIEAGESGGGGGDIPEGATGHADFALGTIWVDGAEVAIETELGSDPASDSAGWSATSFNAGNLTAEGYVFPDTFDNGIALIGELRDKILAGSTIVLEWVSAADLSITEYALILGDSAGNWALYTSRDDVSVGIDLTSFDNVNAAVAGPTGVSTVNRMAATLTPTRAEVSINGGEPTVVALSGNDWPAAGYDVVILDPGSSAILKSITVYDPLPDASGLAALSALE